MRGPATSGARQTLWTSKHTSHVGWRGEGARDEGVMEVAVMEVEVVEVVEVEEA